MTKFPWFKFYSEFLHDPKIRRLPHTDRSIVVHLFCLAAESPLRGSLMMTEGQPLTLEDIGKQIDFDDLDNLLATLKILKILKILKFSERNGKILGSISIVNWEKRQGSDSPSAVNERVKRFRLSQKTPKNETDLKRIRNGFETDLKRIRNGFETQESRREGDNIISAKADDYLRKSDRIKDSLDKTFKGKKGIPMGLAMKMVKEKSEDVVVKALDRMREYYQKGKTIEDPPSYFISICNNL